MKIFFLVFMLCSFFSSLSFAAPVYGPRLPEAKHFIMGFQNHTLFERELEKNQGDIESFQNFLLLSYGILDWFSLDLKGGAGNVKIKSGSDEIIDYGTSFAGGYGFRIKMYDGEKSKAVFGFQHICVHPHHQTLDSFKHTTVLDDWQFSLLVSRDLVKVTPYLGAYWSRVDYIHAINGESKRQKSDASKSLGMFLGADIPLSKKSWLNIEGQYLGSIAAAASLNFMF